MTATQPGPAWSDTSWCSSGELLIYIRRPNGDSRVGQERDSGETAWLWRGARGVVVEPPRRGYARHRCPNHDMGLEYCACGDDGWIGEHAAWAVVAWEMDDGGEPFRRAIERDGEGTDWKRDTNGDGR